MLHIKGKTEKRQVGKLWKNARIKEETCNKDKKLGERVRERGKNKMKNNDGLKGQAKWSGECVRGIRARRKSGLSNRIRKQWSIAVYKKRARTLKKGM